MLYIYYFFVSLFTSHSTKRKIFTTINNTVHQMGGEIIHFVYDSKYFGNIILMVKKDNKEYKYVVDRGEIYLNNTWICDNSYMREENKDPHKKLIEVIVSTIDS